ncbi:MAG: serine hydrolase domain-containing protein [Deltaproteobacteria bacterium]|nr:serine hydrolase domain-containing protein [Deltaproteobacteria bacterium]
MADRRHFADSPLALGIDADKLEALFTRAEREVRDGLLPSMQIAVARHGRVAAMRTIGRVARGGVTAAAADDTLYVIFSATKAITASAAWLLIAAGRLRLDARVTELIPEFGDNGKGAVTVEQLFTHTSGFPHAPFDALDWDDRRARLERFRSWRLNWEPGTRFEYHPTSSMWVIAELVERAADMPFRDFVRQRIALPLGLPDLWVGLPAEQQARVADLVPAGEAPRDEELRGLGFPIIPVGEVTEDALLSFNRPAVRAVGVPGGGGITTAADLALFYQALLHGGLPGGATVWQPQTLAMARQVRSGALRDPYFRQLANRGLGIIVAGDTASRTFRGFGHVGSPLTFGHNGAGGQLAWADPESGVSLAYLTNGLDRHPLRQARRGVGISSRAGGLLA